jgi:glycosyltransferase involved in cell wall biosynthesis
VRVLMVHNEYRMPGGEDESTRVEEELLRSHGVTVESYRVSNKQIPGTSGISTAANAIWSRETYSRVRAVVREKKYDIVHVQNFFPLISPAVYYAAKSEGAAVVQTLRNYRLLCPNALFFREGSACEDCLGRSVPWPAVIHRCYRGSLVASGAVAAMLMVHRALRTWSRQVDVFIALTKFASEKFVKGGFPARKIVVKPNFAFSRNDVIRGVRDDHFLYAGRLSEEKGIATLLDAWRIVGQDCRLKVVGTGPLAPVNGAYLKEPHIEFLGERSVSEVADLMERSRSLVFPSLVYEGMPRTIIEAFATGTPVIASRLGAMAEIVEDGVTGIHFELGNAADLAAKVKWARNHPAEMEAMGRAARREHETKYSAERNYKLLIDIYRRALLSSAKIATAHESHTRVPEN